ncbi:MAG: zf-HC2 domain-containing protein [Spirochaetaceae bacterium]|jgi:anti-sigma factor RsiW|nr:zf-HC2 domain-containing protein [Spirochaetaceae bacterium]
MCPDNHIISVYFDGELPSPWKEKLETHLEECPRCRAELEGFKRCSQILQADTSDAEGAKERIWQKMRPLYAGNRPRRRLWGRTIAVPLPAAAIAAGICAALILAAVRPAPAGPPPAQDAISGAGMMDLQGILPVSNMNDVLQYLGDKDTTDIVIIHLPESRSFSTAGEPTIIKASDYPRGIGNR